MKRVEPENARSFYTPEKRQMRKYGCLKDKKDAKDKKDTKDAKDKK